MVPEQVAGIGPTGNLDKSMYSRTRRRSDTRTIELRTTAGRWLRELRQKRGLSQRELAQKVGAQFTFVSQVESGRCRMPPERYLVWADALGMTPRPFVQGLLRYYDPVTHDVLVADLGPAPPSPSPGSQTRPTPVARADEGR